MIRIIHKFSLLISQIIDFIKSIVGNTPKSHHGVIPMGKGVTPKKKAG